MKPYIRAFDGRRIRQHSIWLKQDVEYKTPSVLYVSDNSGPTPDTCEDGPLRVDGERAFQLTTLQGMPAVSVPVFVERSGETARVLVTPQIGAFVMNYLTPHVLIEEDEAFVSLKRAILMLAHIQRRKKESAHD